MTARSVLFSILFSLGWLPPVGLLRYVLRLASVRYELYGTLLVCCVRAEASRELSLAVSDSVAAVMCRTKHVSCFFTPRRGPSCKM